MSAPLLLAILLVAGATFALIWPLVARPQVDAALTAPEGEDDMARTAAARRALAESEARAKARPLSLGGRLGFAILLGLFVPAAGVMVYANQGVPEVLITARQEPPSESEDLAGLVDQLGQRLAEQGEDAPLQGWALYARTLYQLARYEEAAMAFERAAGLAERDGVNAAPLHAGAGEAHVFAARGQVTPAARAAFEKALAAAPQNPAARYYLAVADLDDGKADKAYDALWALAGETDPTQPFYPVLMGQLARAAEMAGKPMPERAAPPPAPLDMTDEQMQMIRAMVDGLAARLVDEPDNLEGWQRLARARAVLGEYDLAANAHLQVLRLAPGDEAARAALLDLAPRLKDEAVKARVAAQLK